jgi:hypothetical protein
VSEDSVQFWLDNKMSAGIKVAAIGDQALVAYREKFYVVEKGAAHTKGGKALRYSKSSLPAVWKKVLKGEVVSAESLVMPADDALPVSTTTKRERVRAESRPLPVNTIVQSPASDQSVTGKTVARVMPAAGNQKKTEIRQAVQATVITQCPHCNFKHQLPLEKGKNGKPFFMVCEKCATEFAVRFVQVMAYQAQVAAFR